MRVLVQRVSSAGVRVSDQVVAEIGVGLLLFVGVGRGDDSAAAVALAKKIANLRIFPDDSGRMNRSALEIGGAALVVSQFTLLADCRRGRRPAFTDAAAPKIAEELYLKFAELVEQRNIRVRRGVFAADMKVSLVNDAPVTIVIDRKPPSETC